MPRTLLLYIIVAELGGSRKQNRKNSENFTFGRALARALPCVDVGARGVPARARVKLQNQTANPHFLDTVPCNHTSEPPAPPTLNTIPIGYNFVVQEWNYTLTGVKMQIMFDFVPERV